MCHRACPEAVGLRSLRELWLVCCNWHFSCERSLYLLLLCFWSKGWKRRDICRQAWKKSWVVSGTVPEEVSKQKEEENMHWYWRRFSDNPDCISTHHWWLWLLSALGLSSRAAFPKSGKSPLEPTCCARLPSGCFSLSLFFSPSRHVLLQVVLHEEKLWVRVKPAVVVLVPWCQWCCRSLHPFCISAVA